MLAIILLFLQVFSINPIQVEIDECKAIGTDLIACQQKANCTFYKITERRTWDLDHALNVAIQAPDGATFAWYPGNVTNINGEMITVTRLGCDSSDEIPCAVRDSRYSFRFREPTPFEFIGMRVDVHREYFGRWIKTELTSIEKADWSDLWAYGGEFGDIVGLTPFDVRASQGQDCQLDPAVIPEVAKTIVDNSGQSEHGLHCAKIYKQELCSDDYNLNCQWNSTLSVCLLNEVTDILIRCYANSGIGRDACVSDTDCRWIESTKSNNEDSYCINSSSTLSVLFLLLIVLLLC